MAVYVRTSKKGPLNEHQNVENTLVPDTLNFINQVVWYYNCAPAATLLTQAITLTKRCLVVVVLTVVREAGDTVEFKIQRLGVDRTIEETMSGTKFGWASAVGYLIYATELLEAGTHTYSVVNTGADDGIVMGATIKIVAVARG